MEDVAYGKRNHMVWEQEVTPRPISGTHLLASFSDTQKAELESIITVAVAASRPKWQILIAWVLSLIIPAFGYVLQVREVMDQVANQQVEINNLVDSKISKDVVLEHWRSIDYQIVEIQENDKRIEAEIKH